MVDSSFVKYVEEECDIALCLLGAKRPRSGTRFFEISKDVLCWIGLNKGRHEESLRINPFIGIHNVPIMSLKAQIDGKKYKKGEFATISVHLGELCSDVEQFIFYENDDIVVEATRLAKTIYEYGIDYANQFMKIESLLPILKSKIDMLGGYPERYAICLYLSGDIEGAKQFVAATKRKYLTEEDVDTQNRFGEFSQQFLDILK